MWTKEEEAELIRMKTKGCTIKSIRDVVNKSQEEIRIKWKELQKQRPELVGIDRFTFQQNQLINKLNCNRRINKHYTREDCIADIKKAIPGITEEEIFDRALLLDSLPFKKNSWDTQRMECICWKCSSELFESCSWLLHYVKFDGLKFCKAGYVIKCPRYDKEVKKNATGT